MKKLLLAISLSLLAVFAATPAWAQNTRDIVCNQINQFDQQCGTDRILGPGGLITRIAQTMVFVAGAISVIIIIIAGLMYIFSTGDPNNTKRAKDAILYAIVGLVVAIFAQAIVSFVLARL